MAHLKKAAGSGHLLKSPAGHLAMGCGDGCTCDGGSMPSSVTLSGTVLPCVDCGTEVGDTFEWNNVFLHLGACIYGADTDGHAFLLIDGYEIDACELRWDSVQCLWIITIHCEDGGDVWIATKSDPSTPIGTYTRTSGCDVTASRTVS